MLANGSRALSLRLRLRFFAADEPGRGSREDEQAADEHAFWGKAHQVYHNSMPRVAPAVPEQSALLCEKCGYIINGIDLNSRCPECATPIAESLPTVRHPPLWEQSSPPTLIRFIIT